MNTGDNLRLLKTVLLKPVLSLSSLPMQYGWLYSSLKPRSSCSQGLTLLTSQLNLSAFYGIGGARKGYVARVKGVSGGVQGCVGWFAYKPQRKV